jgi:hypothetical protein
MSTLGEIEAAVEALPTAEQRALLSHLESRLKEKPAHPVNRDGWLRRLAGLRARTRPGGTSIQELMDGLRGTGAQ